MEEKGLTEDEMVDHVSDKMDMALSSLQELVLEQGSLACCSQWGNKNLDTTE